MDHVPALQVEHEYAPAGENIPATQLWHVAIDVAATTEENVPAEHKEHDDDPATEYVPTLQFKHVCVDKAPETDDHVPALHKKQLAALIALLHVPALQDSHDVADAKDQVPAPHGRH